MYSNALFIDKAQFCLYNLSVCSVAELCRKLFAKENNVRSKKLLTLIIVVAVLIVIVVVLSSVFAVRQALPVYHNFEGGQVGSVEGAPTSDDILKLAKGSSILFLSKDKLVQELNSANTEWHAIGVVKDFPNIVEVHFVRRIAVVKVDIGGGDVYLDSFGFVVDAPTDGSKPLDITSALELPSVAKQNVKGQKFQFASETNNKRLECVLESIMALWQCKCEIVNIPTILGKSNVFTFGDDGAMTITTRVGAKIIVMSPESEDLTDNLINAFSVYCDGTRNLATYGTQITVWPDGKVTTPQK